MYYAMADIHGEFELFKALLKQIQFKSTDYLFVLGDVIDRGEESLTTLFYILQQPNMKMLRGNHEQMLLDILENSTDILQLIQDIRKFMDTYELEEEYRQMLGVDYNHLYWRYFRDWAYNGGIATMKQLIELEVEDILELREVLGRLPYYEIYQGKERAYLLVHAGINATPLGYKGIPTWKKLKNYQRPKDLLWSRENFYQNKALEDVHIIFGHTPTFYINGQHQIWKDRVYGDKTGIDCGVSLNKLNGKLACVNLDTLEAYYQSR